MLASPAEAATYRYNNPETCTTYAEYGFTVCSGSSGQYSAAQTSGVWVYNSKGTSTYTVTSSDYYESRSEAVKITNVSTKANYVFRYAYSQDFTYYGMVCSVKQDYIFVNGQIRVNDSAVECT